MEKKKHMSESDIESLIDHIGSKIACVIHNNKLYVINHETRKFVSFNNSNDILDLMDESIYYTVNNRLMIPIMVFSNMDSLLDFVIDENLETTKKEIDKNVDRINKSLF